MAAEGDGRDLVIKAILQLAAPEDQQRALEWLVRAVTKPQVTPLPQPIVAAAVGTGLANVSLSQQQPLTPREAMAVALLAQGRSTEEVAAEMAISRTALRNHLRNVVGKVNVAADTTESDVETISVGLTTFPVRLPRDQYAALKQWCKESNFSMAIVVRGLVERFLLERAADSA